MALILAGSSVKSSPVANIRISTVRPGTDSSQVVTRSKKVNLKNRRRANMARSIPSHVSRDSRNGPLRRLTKRGFVWDNRRRRAELSQSMIAIPLRPRVVDVRRGHQQGGIGRPRPAWAHGLWKIGRHNRGRIASKVRGEVGGGRHRSHCTVSAHCFNGPTSSEALAKLM